MQQSVEAIWKANLESARSLLDRLLTSPDLLSGCARFSTMLTELYQRKGVLFTCGNGGSHCDAMHFAEELTGRFHKDRRPLGAVALGDPSHTTCVGNDYGFDHIFERQVAALGRSGDLLVGISTSGNSKNVILAVEAARRNGMKTVALLGKDGGKLKSMVDLPIVIPAESTDRIQEAHIKVIHTVIETVERALFPENY
jgi:D-sedoheptulose 7-phosphate isomerase